MTITTEELILIDDELQYNTASSVKSAEYRLQKILGLLDVGDPLFIENLNIELKTVAEFKDFAKGKYYFSLLNFNDLLERWRNES